MHFRLSETAPTFNNKTLTNLSIWLKAYGDKFIYIYGDMDPWSATVPVSDQVDSEWFMMKEK